MTEVDASERALLGGLLEEPNRWSEVAGELTAADFHAPHHQSLWRCIRDRFDKGRPVGVLELAGDLTPDQVRLLGGLAYVAELPRACPSATNLPYYASQVRAASLRRRLRDLGEGLTRAAVGQGEDAERTPGELAERAMRQLAEVTAPAVQSMTLDAAWRAAESTRGSERRFATGYPGLDRMLDGGLATGDAMVVAARPSMGKTAFALSLAASVATHVEVGVVSLEMPAARVADRLMARLAEVGHSAVRTGHRTEAEEAALAQVRGSRIHIWHQPGVGLAQVTGQMRRWWSRGVRLVVVDYLTLIREPPAYRGESTSERVGRVMQGLKDVATQLEQAVVVLSQLNRKLDQRTMAPRGKADPTVPWWETVALPSDADLLWSTEIEGIADVILFPLRAARLGVKQVYGLNLERAAALYVLKNRNGPTGFVPVWWEGSTASYHSFEGYMAGVP